MLIGDSFFADTLIEILKALAIISILMATLFVTLESIKSFQETRKSTRINDINSILTAIHSYIVVLMMRLSQQAFQISMSATELGTGGLDPSTPLVKYLKTVPIGSMEQQQRQIKPQQ